MAPHVRIAPDVPLPHAAVLAGERYALKVQPA
jgi:hypothetical protein